MRDESRPACVSRFFYFFFISCWTLDGFVHNMRDHLYLSVTSPTSSPSVAVVADLRSWLPYYIWGVFLFFLLFFFFFFPPAPLLTIFNLIYKKICHFLSHSHLVRDEVPTWVLREDLQTVGAAEPSAAKASVWGGPLLQGWPASHPAMHLSPLLHLHQHNEAQSQISEGGLTGLLMSRHH